ncbi:MAG TPA: hypothetical protein VNT03_14905 [Baekduia sp.]|nr:hypothetical protein [Baekduia sp.]
MPTPPAQLIVYAFGPEARFEGLLAGALERIETGGALRILEVLLVRRDPDSGELTAFEHRGNGAAGFTAPLVSFRLDRGERARATAQALDGVAGQALREMGRELEPGGALAAVFLSHVWAGTLADAAERTGGTLMSDELVDAEVLMAELGR